MSWTESEIGGAVWKIKVLLDVQGLKTYFHTFKGVVKAVDNVSFNLKEGEES